MSEATLVTTSPSLPATAAELEDVRRYIASSIAPATLRAYRSGIANFRTWCDIEGCSALPASSETVARYLAALADEGKSVSTIQQRLAAIKWVHESQDLETPTAGKGVRARPEVASHWSSSWLDTARKG